LLSLHYWRRRKSFALWKRVAEELTARLGRGFSKHSLEQYRRFYDCYREIAQSMPAQSLGISLGWQEIRQAMSGKSPGSVSDAVITLRVLSAEFADHTRYVEYLSTYHDELCYISPAIHDVTGKSNDGRAAEQDHGRGV
jgi:hypothetical protein